MDRTAQGIAEKGRYGDTTLVHMAPSELKGIEQLAGKPVTYNPDTGLPEMFSLKEFLAIAAPAAGAAILGPAFAGSALLGGGVGAGALGAGVGSALGTLVAGGNSDEALQSGLITGLTAGIGGTLFGGKAGAANTGGGATGGTSNVTQQGINLGADIPTTTAATTPSTTTITPPTGSPSFVYDPNISPMNLSADVPVNVESVTAPDTGGGLFRNMFSGIKQRAQDTEAYKEPAKAIGYGLSGTVGGVATAPMVANTLEEDGPKYGDVDMSDPYRRQVFYPRGIGSREGQFFRPSGMYIKEGGYIKKMQEGGEVEGGVFAGGNLMEYAPGIMGVGEYNYMDYVPTNSMPGITSLDSTVEGTNFKGVDPSRLISNKAAMEKEEAAKKASQPQRKMIGRDHLNQPIYAPDPYFQNSRPRKMVGLDRLNQPIYAKEGGSIEMQDGGTVGIVKGPGDGMSDSIYGTMRDVPNQRVALSDGEFVVPSDIVSGIGNGSTDAGAEKLYAMMDRVRNARTGQVQQAPEINPEEFLPA